MNRDELLDALTAERYDGRWFATPQTTRVEPVDAGAYDDSQITCARRMREALEDEAATMRRSA